MVIRGQCPFCGATVIVDEAKRKSSHLAPECQGFVDWIKANARKPVTTFVEVLDPVTGELRPAAKA